MAGKPATERERIDMGGLVEGRREWTIYVCPTCGRTRVIGNICSGANGKRHPAIGFEEVLVREVGVSLEEERPDSGDWERGFADGVMAERRRVAGG